MPTPENVAPLVELVASDLFGGLMYSGVPTTFCTAVTAVPVGVMSFAIPKSSRRTSPLLSLNVMLGVLRSRWEHARGVDGRESLRHLDGHVERVRGREGPALAQDAMKVDPVHELHGHEAIALVFAVLVNGAHVPVADLAGQLDLRAEALGQLGGPRGLRVEELDRHDLVQHAIVGSVDPAETAHAEEALDDVAAAPAPSPRAG